MAGRPRPIPQSIVVGLALAVALDTVAQIAWKSAANQPAPLASPFFYAAMIAVAAQFVNWLRVLARADLSFAQPITALSYITVLAASSRWLHEAVSATRIAGVALILAGVFLISRTPSATVAPLP